MTWKRTFGPSAGSRPTIRVQFVFLKALALIYFIAFLSFGMQVTGLIGQRGILPWHVTCVVSRK